MFGDFWCFFAGFCWFFDDFWWFFGCFACFCCCCLLSLVGFLWSYGSKAKVGLCFRDITFGKSYVYVVLFCFLQNGLSGRLC